MAERIIDLPTPKMESDLRFWLREEIVRCRDCKHCSDHEWVLVTDVSDVCHFFGDGVKVEPDGFCKWSEPREASADA